MQADQIILNVFSRSGSSAPQLRVGGTPSVSAIAYFSFISISPGARRSWSTLRQGKRRGIELSGYKTKDRIVERIIGVAGDHVVRSRDIDELRMRNQRKKLACALVAH